MAITLANAITEVRYTLNEASASYWSDAEITAWIQEGTRIFSSKTLMVEDAQDLDPLKANQLVYTSSDETWLTNVLEFYTAIYYDGVSAYKGLIKVHPREIGNLATFTAGAPKYYALHNRSVYIWPITTAAIVSAGGKITFLFAKETDDITDLNDEFQHLPVIYATARAKQKDQKFAESNSLLMQFYNEVNFERGDKHNREVESLEQFEIPRRGGRSSNAPG